ncbi:MAG: hypothetical protein JWM53_553 [bacterium]|nr:hypothetical protein [bacterium]
MMPKLAVLVCLLLGAGCYGPNLADGKLKCSVGDQKCPEGFHCATDGTCWKNGHDPGGGGGGGTGGGGLAAHKGTSVMTGGTTASSEHYKVIMSTGQAPGGNVNGSSETVKSKGGVVGATQGK